MALSVSKLRLGFGHTGAKNTPQLLSVSSRPSRRKPHVPGNFLVVVGLPISQGFEGFHEASTREDLEGLCQERAVYAFCGCAL